MSIPFRAIVGRIALAPESALGLTDGSRGRWGVVQDPMRTTWMLGCEVCGTRMAVNEVAIAARCACDRRASEGAWREHFGVLAEVQRLIEVALEPCDAAEARDALGC